MTQFQKLIQGNITLFIIYVGALSLTTIVVSLIIGWNKAIIHFTLPVAMAYGIGFLFVNALIFILMLKDAIVLKFQGRCSFDRIPAKESTRELAPDLTFLAPDDFPVSLSSFLTRDYLLIVFMRHLA